MKETDSNNESRQSNEGKSRSFLASYADTSTTANISEPDEYQAFSFGRVGSRSQPMITFYKNDDYVEAISYANLNRVWSSDINREIKLDFGVRSVRIEGENISDLFDYITNNRCAEVSEQSHRQAMGSHGSLAIVVRITFS